MITMTLAKTALLDASDCRQTKNLEKLNTSACYHSCVSVGYLWFFDQLQQVFDMLSQQILALPHLIQSSARIQKRTSVQTFTGQQM